MHQARGEQGELVKNGFQKFFLFFVSIPLWSRLWGWLTHIRRPRFLVRWMIGRFSRHYAIAMEQYAGGLDDYGSLADFFVRPLNPRLRPLRPIAGHIVSPADGRLSQLERIEQDTATQVKGSTYSLSCLLGRDLDFSQGWYVATIYLAPANYHRFHFPSSGVLRRYRHMGGRLFPVNAFSVNRVQRIYARNERVVAEIEGNGGPLFLWLWAPRSWVASAWRSGLAAGAVGKS